MEINSYENLPAGSPRIEELQRQIEEVRKSWPAHSVPGAMLQHLEELEDELDELQIKHEGGRNA
jgi:hypothetical protein